MRRLGARGGLPLELAVILHLAAPTFMAKQRDGDFATARPISCCEMPSVPSKVTQAQKLLGASLL